MGDIYYEITSSYILMKLEKFRKNEELFDVALVIDSTEFKCHRIVLAIFSDYFSTMFTNTQFPEHKKDRIEMKDIDKNAFSAFLDFVYTGKVTFTEDNIRPCLLLAKMLLADFFVNVAIDYAKSSINISNVVEYYVLSKELGLKKFNKFTLKFLCKNISQILHNETFFNLPFDAFKDIFLTELEENDYLNCIIRWVKFDLNERLKYFDELLESVRFDSNIDDDSILQQLSEQEKILFRKIKEAKNKSIVIDSMCVIQHVTRYINRNRKRTFCQVEKTFNVYSYTRNLKNEFKTLPKIIMDETHDYRLALLQEELFLCYSSDPILSTPIKLMHHNISNQSSSQVHINKKLKMDNTEWKQCTSINARIDSIPSLIADNQENKIYASFTHEETSPLLYCYNADIDNWFAIDEVDPEIFGRSLVMYDNVLYLFGGTTGSDGWEEDTSDVITIYDPRIKSSQNIGVLNEPCFESAAVVHNNNIYITGGYSLYGERNVTNIVQRYDIVAGKTETISKMNFEKTRHCAVSYNNKIWVAGGKKEYSRNDPIETYNEISCLWKGKKWAQITWDNITLYTR